MVPSAAAVVAAPAFAVLDFSAATSEFQSMRCSIRRLYLSRRKSRRKKGEKSKKNKSRGVARFLCLVCGNLQYVFALFLLLASSFLLPFVGKHFFSCFLHFYFFFFFFPPHLLLLFLLVLFVNYFLSAFGPPSTQTSVTSPQTNTQPVSLCSCALTSTYKNKDEEEKEKKIRKKVNFLLW